MSLRAVLTRLRDEARAITARQALRELLRAYDRNDLLTFASAIAFQVFFALIPLALFGVGLLGGVGLEETWTQDVAPDVRDSTSPQAFHVIDTTVRTALEDRQVFWMTLGGVIAVWEMSGAVRAIMDAFDRIHGSDRKRSFWERYRVSTLLALGAGLLVLGAVAVVQLGPAVAGDGAAFGIARWLLAAALLSGAVTLLVHHAPARSRSRESAGLGSLLVVVAWLGTSVAFTAYLTQVADYGSIFGALATIIVVFQYLYMASVAFLTGAQVDAILHGWLEE